MPKPKKQRREPEMLTRLASFQPSTFDGEARTIELVWSAGADVKRRDYWTGKEYVERLSMDESAIDLSRLNNGAPLLNSHRMDDLSSQIGVVERAWIEGRKGVAIVRFSQRDDVAPIMRDVQDGIIRNVSVGFRIHETKITERKGEPSIHEATRWEPLELSFVTVNADSSSNTRSVDDEEVEPCADDNNRAVAQTKERQMDPKENNGGSPVAEKNEIDTRALQNEAVAAERERQRSIRAAARSLRIADDVVDEMIDGGTSVDDARARMIDLHARQAETQRIAAVPSAQADRISSEDPAFKRAAMSEALFARAMQGLRKVEPSDPARAFMHMRFTDIAGELLRDAGVRGVDRMSRSQKIENVLSRSSQHTTSDFANIVLDAQNKILLNEYAVAEPTYKKIAVRNNFADFKTHNLIRLGDFPDLLEVGEGGEIKAGTMKDSKETASLKSYGRDIKLSRQLLINDDMGAFNRLPVKVGQRAADLENRLVLGILAKNSGAGPTMSDGNAMFSTAHANKATTASAIDVANVALGIAAIRKQTGMTDDKKSSGVPLNLTPRYMLCGPDRELQARQLLAQVMATKPSDYNPYAGTMEALVDANVSGYLWYLFADPMQAEALIYGYLDGADGPRLLVKDADIDGIVMRVLHDFAAAAVDSKPAYFNAGA